MLKIFAKKSSIFEPFFQKFGASSQKKLTRCNLKKIMIEASAFKWWSKKIFSQSRTHLTDPRTPRSRL